MGIHCWREAVAWQPGYITWLMFQITHQCPTVGKGRQSKWIFSRVSGWLVILFCVLILQSKTFKPVLTWKFYHSILQALSPFKLCELTACLPSSIINSWKWSSEVANGIMMIPECTISLISSFYWWETLQAIGTEQRCCCIYMNGLKLHQ